MIKNSGDLLFPKEKQTKEWARHEPESLMFETVFERRWLSIQVCGEIKSI